MKLLAGGRQPTGQSGGGPSRSPATDPMPRGDVFRSPGRAKGQRPPGIPGVAPPSYLLSPAPRLRRLLAREPLCPPDTAGVAPSVHLSSPVRRRPCQGSAGGPNPPGIPGVAPPVPYRRTRCQAGDVVRSRLLAGGQHPPGKSGGSPSGTLVSPSNVASTTVRQGVPLPTGNCRGWLPGEPVGERQGKSEQRYDDRDEGPAWAARAA